MAVPEACLRRNIERGTGAEATGRSFDATEGCEISLDATNCPGGVVRVAGLAAVRGLTRILGPVLCR
jgi:hypothetical protein